MDDKTRDKLVAELTDVLNKYDAVIMSDADADDDSGLNSWIEIYVKVKEPTGYKGFTRLETVFVCDELPCFNERLKP